MNVKMNLAAAIGFMLSAATTTAQVADLDGGPMGIERVAMSVGTAIPYISVPSAHNAPNWIQIDLGQPFPVEAARRRDRKFPKYLLMGKSVNLGELGTLRLETRNPKLIFLITVSIFKI